MSGPLACLSTDTERELFTYANYQQLIDDDDAAADDVQVSQT